MQSLKWAKQYEKHQGVSESTDTQTFKYEPFLKTKRKNTTQKPQHTTSQVIAQYYNVLLCAKLTIYKMKYKHVPGVSDTGQTDKNATDLCMYNTHAAHDIFVIICLTLRCSHQTWGEPHVPLKRIALIDLSRVQSVTHGMGYLGQIYGTHTFNTILSLHM